MVNVHILFRGFSFHSVSRQVSGFYEGIVIGAWHSSGSGYDGVLVEGCVMHDCVEHGMQTYGYWPLPAGVFSHKNITIRDCTAYDITGDPTITNQHTGSGIIISGTDGGLMEYCTAHHTGYMQASTGGGPVGLWAWDASHVIIRYCLSYNNSRGNGRSDGGGFDLDGGVINSIMEYNYAYNNAGPSFLICQFSGARAYSNNTCRYNIGENNARSSPNSGDLEFYSVGSSGGITYVNAYGNTLYTNKPSSNSPSVVSVLSNPYKYDYFQDEFDMFIAMLLLMQVMKELYRKEAVRM